MGSIAHPTHQHAVAHIMTRPDRSGFQAALLLWVMCLVGVALLGLEVTDDTPKRWLGHWIVIVWSFIGWLPALLRARREPQSPEDRQ
jgi:hypothetical protein